MRNNRKGFTIVELVIVIAVIGILAAVLIPTFSSVTENARVSARLQETRNAMVEYMTDHDGYIAEGTVFKYNDDGDEYYFVYRDGELTIGDASDIPEGYVATLLSSNVSVYELAPEVEEPEVEEPENENNENT